MGIEIGYQGNKSAPQGSLQFLVVGEEEQFVFLDGPADAAAKLILAERRRVLSVKEIARVKSVVAQKLISRTVKGVGAGFAGRIHHRAVTAELRVVSVGKNGEFRDGLNAKRRTHHAGAGAVGPESLNILVVEQVRLTLRPRAGNGKVGLVTVEKIAAAVADLPSRSDAGRQRDQIRKVAAVQGEICDLFLFYHGG